MDAYFIHLGSKVDKYRSPPGPDSMLQELSSLALWRACLAEFLATMVFLFLGCSSAVTATTSKTMAASPPPIVDFGNDSVDTTSTPVLVTMEVTSIVQIGFGFGLAIMAMVQFIGHVSGGHINPAVSLAMAISRHVSPLRAVLYVVSQVLGGVVGSAILYGIVGDKLGNSVNNVNAPSISAAQGFGNEVMLTFILVSVIYGTTDSDRRDYGSVSLAIGLTVAVGHFAGVGISGASMNPARSFGPAVIMGMWDNHWVYWVGPVVGGALASVIYKYGLRPYRGIKSYEDAAKQMLKEQSELPVPSDFQIVVTPRLSSGGDNKTEGHTNRGFELEQKA